MTDDEVIKRATTLCDRGTLRPQHESTKVERLKRIVSEDDAFEIRWILPALIEIIERRGLK